MTNRPSVPEIITVNSEALQTQIRDLLPSQNGFGSELQASNVITPIIDLTAAAEGSGLPVALQNAIAFGSNTFFQAINTTVTLVSSPGFYRVVGTSNINPGASAMGNDFVINDGVSDKSVWYHYVQGTSVSNSPSVTYDLVFFLRAGDTLKARGSGTNAVLIGSHRQIATGDGTLVEPVGYPL